jgi:hypothetical protein
LILSGSHAILFLLYVVRIDFVKDSLNYAQGFSKVLFSTSGGREERKWGHLGAEPIRLNLSPGKRQQAG